MKTAAQWVIGIIFLTIILECPLLLIVAIPLLGVGLFIYFCIEGAVDNHNDKLRKEWEASPAGIKRKQEHEAWRISPAGVKYMQEREAIKQEAKNRIKQEEHDALVTKEVELQRILQRRTQ